MSVDSIAIAALAQVCILGYYAEVVLINKKWVYCYYLLQNA